jgi:hypothetical protein
VHSSALFATVPQRDYFLFWQSGRFQPQRVARFLGFNKAEVAAIVRGAASSVRFDDKAPRALLERMSEIASLCTLVAEVFGGDATQSSLWFKTPNPQLESVSPREMILSGRCDELRRIVLEAACENPAKRAGEAACESGLAARE